MIHRKQYLKAKNSRSFIDPDEILVDSISVLGGGTLTEGKIELPIAAWSHIIFLLVALCGVGYLGARAFSLQIKSGEQFFAKSQENRFVVRPVFPPRGVIYDRFHNPLVENVPSFGLMLEKDEFLQNKGDLRSLMPVLESILKKPAGFFYEAGIPEDYNTKNLLNETIIMQDLAPEDLVALAPRLATLPGLHTFESFRRAYKYPEALSHLLGFVGKPTGNDLQHNAGLHAEELIGKGGIESQYDSQLRGTGGKKIIEVDAAGHETKVRLVEEPREGAGITLTIDGELQRVAYETLDHYTVHARGASIVILDPRDGAVRALISYPGFDSNQFGYSLTQKKFNAILNDPLKPLFNRAIAGEFPPGSTVKPLFAAAALQENLIDPNKKIYDGGFIEIPNPYKPGEKTVFPDWRKHGWINFYDALALSANVYFYMIGGGYQDQQGLGIDRLKKYALAFGLGSTLGIDLPGERPGLIPDPEWKKKAEPNNPIWRIGDTYHVSIGQGGVKTTPLQMAALTAALANEGKLYQPHILDTMSQDGVEQHAEPRLIREGMVGPYALEQVHRGMRQTVTTGTAHLLNTLSITAAAKTGTAQAGSGMPHAWVTVFAPAEDPEIAIVVMVEHAGEGATIAVPITRDILDWYVANRVPGPLK